MPSGIRHDSLSAAALYESITPDDDTALPHFARALWVGVAGDLVVKRSDGTEVTFTNVPVGLFTGVIIERVMEATTCDELVALY